MLNFVNEWMSRSTVSVTNDCGKMEVEVLALLRRQEKRAAERHTVILAISEAALKRRRFFRA